LQPTIVSLKRGAHPASAGVYLNAYDADGATLTYVAAAHGHTAMVELLVDEAGADISKATPDDAKALLIESWRLDLPPRKSEMNPMAGRVRFTSQR
jgi:hypothetical protein